MAVIYVAGGSLGVGQSAKWYVWWPGQIYLGPIVFQASPLDPGGELEVRDHTSMRTSASPPPSLPPNLLVHSFVVGNRGSASTSYYLWCLRE
jgi:hypothetical protein